MTLWRQLEYVELFSYDVVSLLAWARLRISSKLDLYEVSLETKASTSISISKSMCIGSPMLSVPVSTRILWRQFRQIDRSYLGYISVLISMLCFHSFWGFRIHPQSRKSVMYLGRNRLVLTSPIHYLSTRKAMISATDFLTIRFLFFFSGANKTSIHIYPLSTLQSQVDIST